MITVDDRSALARWSEPGLVGKLGEPLAAGTPWTTDAASVRDETVLRAARLMVTPEHPLHVLVPDPARRIRTPGVVSHVWSTPLPEGALVQLTPEVLIASPSFCLQNISARDDEIGAAVAAMEICGSYGRSIGAPNGFYKRAPLESLEGLRAHFDATHSHGARRARIALSHVVPGARSPMETVVVLLFTLPVELGGCGLPAPQLNVRIEIPPSLQAALRKPYVVVDLCWRDRRIILEYDSYLWHSSARAVDSDSTRNEGLRDQGWMVRSVTSGMLSNDAMRRELVGRVMARFGRELPSGEAFDRLQSRLVRRLLSC